MNVHLRGLVEVLVGGGAVVNGGKVDFAASGYHVQFFNVTVDDMDWAEKRVGGTRTQIAYLDAGDVELHESLRSQDGRIELYATPRRATPEELGVVRVAYRRGVNGPAWVRGEGELAPWEIR